MDDMDVGQPTTKGATSEEAVELTQECPTYPWEKLRPSCLCSCYNFVLQLVLLASCGSFMFGFNISLLNTALQAINSDMQICGETHLAIKLMKEMDDHSLNQCRNLSFCRDDCGIYDNDYNPNEMTDFKCPGGYNDLDCGKLKWMNAVITCAILIGGAVGSMTGGQFMGMGRRFLLIIDMVIFAVGVVCSVCANSYSSLLWARLIVGYGVGVASVVSPTYMSEVTPPARRGSYGVFHQLFVTVGIFVAVVIGLPLTNPTEQGDFWEPPTFQRFWWRFMLGLGIIPSLVGLYFFITIYSFETPVYYVEQKRYKDAAALLERLYMKQDVREELNTTINNVKIGEENKLNGLTFGKALQDKEYRWVIFVGCGLAAFQQFGGINVFMTSSSDLFRKAGLNGTMQTVVSVIMTAINCLMTFPTIYLIEKMGRRTLLFWGSLFQFICVVPAAISYWTESNADDPHTVTKILAIVAVLGFVIFFAVAFGPIVWVYLFEIYPMEIKDVAAAVATACNWIAGIIMVFVSIVLPNQISFTLFAVLQLLATLFVFFFMRETRGIPLGESPYITKKEIAV